MVERIQCITQLLFCTDEVGSVIAVYGVQFSSSAIERTKIVYEGVRRQVMRDLEVYTALVVMYVKIHPCRFTKLLPCLKKADQSSLSQYHQREVY